MIEFNRSTNFSHTNLNSAANTSSGKRANEGDAAKATELNRVEPVKSSDLDDAPSVKTELTRRESVQPEQSAVPVSLALQFKNNVSDDSKALDKESDKQNPELSSNGLPSPPSEGLSSGSVAKTPSNEPQASKPEAESPRVSQVQSLLQNINRPDASEIIGTQVSVRT